MLLACIGLYGLLSFMVTRRTPEIGLRMALGARPILVWWLLLREGAVTVIAGWGEYPGVVWLSRVRSTLRRFVRSDASNGTIN
jgi:ABC-type lipoprotein release transport system permease subunit